MLPDDPRHGTYAGYIAHRRAGVPRCGPCLVAQRRTRKGYELNGGQMVTLGEDAWRIVHNTGNSALARATGLSTSVLYKIDRKGPTARVYRKTREVLLAQQTPLSHVGIMRRLQALACLGWSARELSRRTGIWPDNLIQIRLGKRGGQDTRSEVATKIVAVYNELHMTPPAPTRHVTATKTLAAKYGWVPPLAWDNIDDPTATPATPPAAQRSNHYDEAVVLRAVAGEHLPMTTPERAEIVARLRKKGMPHTEIERHTGITKVDRHTKRDRRKNAHENKGILFADAATGRENETSPQGASTPAGSDRPTRTTEQRG